MTDGDFLYFLVSGRATLNEEAERDAVLVNRVVALDPTSGEMAWQTPFADDSEVYSPNVRGPAVQAETVVMALQRIQAYETDGERKWQVESGSLPNGPVVADGLVYAATTEKVRAFSTENGSEVATAEIAAETGPTLGRPIAFIDGALVVPTGRGIEAFGR